MYRSAVVGVFSWSGTAKKNHVNVLGTSLSRPLIVPTHSTNQTSIEQKGYMIPLYTHY